MKNMRKAIVHGTLHDTYDYSKMIKLDSNTESSSERVLQQSVKNKQKVYQKQMNTRGCKRGK